ncbi:ABC transporter permease [Anaerocolumna xylanovorans]|uniref:ABC-2 family transporter protein n=1 Tax=Anaerocolumna xylanovorans DSM 12503 TaxID=1121345 RepID=A0A1M7YKW6_9FIRM|nr:ABC transporter permease [Anaerocolumna xylanovorans]SHO53263.1 ABC-2 family transporter protein [Anaerocolumna xylanovorans DSM 12503]
MWLTLFRKECKMWCKSIMFFGYLAVILFFYLTQMGSEDVPAKPEPGKESYGYHYSTDEKVIMETAMDNLLYEYCYGVYVTYPMGFYKGVRLNKEKTEKIEVIIEKLTGKTDEEFKKIINDYKRGVKYESSGGASYQTEAAPLDLKLSKDITYDEFLGYMEQAAKLIGNGSKYGDTYLKSNARVPLTYEEALHEYNQMKEKDRFSGAYARLYCDYFGILLGIIPVFFVTSRVLKDKHSHAKGVLYGKSASSAVIITARMAAICTILFLPILLLSLLPLSQAVYAAGKAGITADYLAFLKYCTGWLLPSIMAVTALGYFLGELTEGVFPILIQVIWWFASLLANVSQMIGGFGYNLIPRFNSLGEYSVFYKSRDSLVWNRIVYTVAALVLTAALVYLYECKRKGIYIKNGKVSKAHIRKSKA